MLEVKFLNYADEKKFKFAVIVSKFEDKWVFCKHSKRNTYESPGGKRKEGETILETAKRELFEETGAIDYKIKEISPYLLIEKKDGKTIDERYGMLYYAQIKTLGKLPDSEIDKIYLTSEIPKNLTYEEIQYELMNKVIGEVREYEK